MRGRPLAVYARDVHRSDEPALPRLTRCSERLTAHPSVARAVDEARPYRALFPLPWPEYAT